MEELLTEDEMFAIGLMHAVRRVLDATGFEPDQDPARGGCKVRIIEGGAVLSVTVPIVDATAPMAALDVTLDRETLGEVVMAVRRRTGLD